VPADLDQFRGEDSHGTIIGGEGLVELGHDPADSGRFFYHIDVIAGICQIERRLHARYAAAHDHDRTGWFGISRPRIPFVSANVFVFHPCHPIACLLPYLWQD